VKRIELSPPPPLTLQCRQFLWDGGPRGCASAQSAWGHHVKTGARHNPPASPTACQPHTRPPPWHPTSAGARSKPHQETPPWRVSVSHPRAPFRPAAAQGQLQPLTLQLEGALTEAGNVLDELGHRSLGALILDLATELHKKKWVGGLGPRALVWVTMGLPSPHGCH